MKLKLLSTTSITAISVLSLCGCNPSLTTHTTSQKPSTHQMVGAARTAPSNHWPSVTVSKVSALPVGVVGNALAVDANGRIASVGGYTGSVSITDIWKVTPPVSTVGHLPIRSHDAAAAYIGTDLFVFGGGQNDSYNTILRLKSGQLKQVGLLAAPLSDAVCLPYHSGGHQGVLLIGGYDGQVFRHTVYFGTENNGRISWQHLFSLPMGYRYVGAATDGQKVYLAGGKTATGLSSAVYQWTPGASDMRKIATLPRAIEKAALFVNGRYLVVAGGLNASGEPQSTLTAVDTLTGKTRVIGHLPTPVGDMGYVQAGAGYIAGGMMTSQETDTSRAVYRLSFH